jgi:hypothetical protein
MHRLHKLSTFVVAPGHGTSAPAAGRDEPTAADAAITLDELRHHRSASSAWVAIAGEVT